MWVEGGFGWVRVGLHTRQLSSSKTVTVQQFGPSDPALWLKEEEPGATLGHPRFAAEKQLTSTILCRLSIEQQHEN